MCRFEAEVRYSGAIGITSALKNSVKKALAPVDRRKHEQWVGVDRRRQDADFAERMAFGVRAWSAAPANQSPLIKKSIK
jgi:hypothetical protein